MPQENSCARLAMSYAGQDGVCDEALNSRGEQRLHWQTLMQALDSLGPESLDARWESGLRMLRDHGATYHAHSGREDCERPWDLDPIPLILSAEEWRHLERGVTQRARLLNLVLQDLYAGPQRLLRDGFIPPALVYANRRFLRPCRGIRAPHDLYLHWYAVDLARAPGGQWRVIADHTHIPVGIGYALENRKVVSQVLPDEFRKSGARRLAPFMHHLAESLRHLVSLEGRPPRIVLLTPGPRDANYFEHAYLARHLGFTLAEAEDLTVRGRCVFLKTLEGLQQVHVIVRGLDEDVCDPLELRDDASTGVAGLIEATRSGTVVLANALGAGLMEGLAFQPYLSAISLHLLGEELFLPCSATWWCGQADDLRHVTDNLDSLVIKPAFDTPTIHTAALAVDQQALEALLSKIRLQPQNFAARNRLQLSTAPVWQESRLQARPVMIRLFAAAGRDGIMVMPGALACAAPLACGAESNRADRWGGKDTWVLPEADAGTISAPAFSLEWAPPDRCAGDLPSRAADNLFWLGRYAERLEHTVRIGRCFLRCLMDESEDARLRLAGLRLMKTLNMTSSEAGASSLADAILEMAYDNGNPEGVPALIRNMRFAASAVRDRLSSDTWRILAGLESRQRPQPDRLPLAAAHAWLNELVLQTAAFSGMEMENMTRGNGWRFLDFGRRLERASNLVQLLHAAHSGADNLESLLESLLEIADSTITYRRLYATPVRLNSLIELLVADADNPRSLAFQLRVLHRHAEAMPENIGNAPVFNERNLARNLMDRAQSELLAELFGAADAGARGMQDNWFRAMNGGLAELSDQLTHHYFSHTMPQVS